MARAVQFPWGGLRPAKEPFLSHPDGTVVEVGEDGRVLGPGKKKRAARKKAAPPPEPAQEPSLDLLGILNELDHK